MTPTDQTAPPAPADVAQPVENASATVTTEAGTAKPVVDESKPQPQEQAKSADPVVTDTAPADVAQPPKAAEPPAQHGDDGEVQVAKATPVLLPSLDEAKKELDANPARTSVLSSSGHLVRE